MPKTISIIFGGHECLIDAADFALVADIAWYRHPGVRTNYAAGCTKGSSRDRSRVLMHRLLMAAPRGVEVDHINGNGLDNRRCNLRLATHSQNKLNQPKRRTTCSSRFKGVTFNKRKQRWVATAWVDGKCKYLGCFCEEKGAARAYNAFYASHQNAKFVQFNEVSP